MIEGLSKLVTGLNRLFLAIAALVIVVLAVFMTYVVIRRYVFSSPLGWALDVARAMFSYSVFFALGPTLQNRNHVSVDLIHERLPARWKYWATTVAWVMVLLYGTLLLWQVGDHTISAFETGRRFPGSWPIEAKYVYVAAPIGVAQFVLTAVSETLRHLAGRSHVPVWDAPTPAELP